MDEEAMLNIPFSMTLPVEKWLELISLCDALSILPKTPPNRKLALVGLRNSLREQFTAQFGEGCLPDVPETKENRAWH